ncbi:extensin family protein [Aestuariivirga sp.]|uniref:extensin-like domain-containing protein n=1 Tax=Aestuariivirga sp. TaxID=2650926 RepID=UPI0039E28197
MMNQLRNGIVLMTSVLLLMLPTTAPVRAETSGIRAFQNDFKRAMQRLDRQLCSKVPGMKCRQAAARPRAEKKAAVPDTGSDKAGAKKDSTKSASATQAPPVPRLKPQAPSQVGNEEVILPKLKPVKTAPADVAVVSQIPQKSDRMQPPPPPPPRKEVVLRKQVAAADQKPPSRLVPPTANPMPDGTLAGDACFAALQKFRVDYTQAATPVSAGACSVYEPVRVNGMRVDGTFVRFPDKPLLTCGFAARLAAWVSDKGAPAVKRATGAPLQAIGTGPGYQCRGRNGDSSGKLSEHAFGNAVDIEYLKTADGGTVSVNGGGFGLTSNARLLKELRSAGCSYFTTVLGPGTNAAHAKHFHFDLEKRGRKGNHKLCE